ncbi:VLRF1 family aeRF1-type release factor [Alkalihalobacillus sp. R86527]|uniref:VLRF1 family aeRF1-type release factor n=1 Tax=Alkalihalobacillus sp. R86527 TaxID=3093863 RepID=UPI003672D922
MLLTEKLNQIKRAQVQKPDKVFTLYLNTDRRDPDRQHGEWKIQLKNGFRNFEDYLKESGNKEEQENFEKVKEKVQDEIDTIEKDLKRGLVIIASSDDQIWFVERTQVPVTTNLYWEEEPQLDQLEQLSNDYPNTGIILVHYDYVRILETELGFLTKSEEYAWDPDEDNWRIYEGTTGSENTPGNGSTAQRELFEDRVKANRERWYKSMASKLDKKSKNRDWEKIYVAGEKEEAEELSKLMNKETEIVGKNYADKRDDEVLELLVS